MTCVVGLVEKIKDKKIVWMGADSAGTNMQTLAIRTRLDPKIYVNDEYIFGYTDSFRMGQILARSFLAPLIPEGMDNYTFMITHFVEEIRRCFKEGGYSKIENNEETGGEFMVGFRGTIYHIFSDYQVGINRENYDAIGCGEEFALGSFFSTDGFIKNPKKRIITALKCAAYFSAAVKEPFFVEKL